MTCEASVVLNALEEDETSFEAAEGTVAHSLAEDWIKNDFEMPDNRLDTVEECSGWEITIDEEMVAYVDDFVSYCESKALVAEDFFSERSVDISDLTPIPDQGGSLDFGWMLKHHLEIVDLKYGKEPVFAFYPDEGTVNKQLAVYAWGVFLEFDWLYHFETITLKICQPRLPHVWSEYTMTRQELIDFADYARERWALTWDIDAPRTPSLKGCRWCKVRAKCPALYLFLAQDLDQFDSWDDDGNEIEAKDMVIDASFQVVSYTNDEMAQANDKVLDQFEPSPFPKLPKPPELSTAALAKILRYRKFMENFFNAVNEELLGRAISDEEDIPWWKLVDSRTLRKLVDDEDHIIEVLTAKGLKLRDLYAPKKIKSPAQLEETLHAKLKMPKAAAKRLLEEEGLTVKPPGRKTLAPSTDNRLALPKDGDVFDVWDDDDDD